MVTKVPCLTESEVQLGMPEQSQEKDLKKLKRSELLEIMLAQSEEIDRLRKELAEKDAQLQDRTIKIQQSGSIAEASLKLTNIFEEAQRAVDLYVANVAPGALTAAASSVTVSQRSSGQGHSAAQRPATQAASRPAASSQVSAKRTATRNVTVVPTVAATSAEHLSAADKTTVLAPLSLTPKSASRPAAGESSEDASPKHFSN